MITKLATISLAVFASSALAGPDAKTPAKDAPKKQTDKPVDMPKPPKELADMESRVLGLWDCTGITHLGNANQKASATAQLEHKLDLDHHWIQTLFSAEMGKAQGETYKFSQFTTYDPNAKKWIRIMLDNLGGSAESTSPGFSGAKIVWEGEQREPNPQLATMKIRTTEEWVSMKEMKMTGEVSKDGKTWTKSYDATCKRK